PPASCMKAQALERTAHERREQQVLGTPFRRYVERPALFLRELAAGVELDRVPQLLRLDRHAEHGFKRGWGSVRDEPYPAGRCAGCVRCGRRNAMSACTAAGIRR